MQDITFILKAKNEARQATKQLQKDMKDAGVSVKQVKEESKAAAENTKAMAKEAGFAQKSFGALAATVVKLGSAISAVGAAVGLGVLQLFLPAAILTRANQLVTTITLLGLAFAGLVGLSGAVKGAREFNAAIAETSTLIEGTPAQLRELTDAASNLVREFGGNRADQVSAFYQAISAGAATVGDAADLLDTANRLAVGGVTDVTTATGILSTAINVYGADTITAQEASDSLFIAMKNGVTTVGELSQNLGVLLPIAKEAGLSFDEVTSAVAALTKSGISTNIATTQLRALIAAVVQAGKEGNAAGKEAQRLGIDFSIAALQSKGLAQFLREVTEGADGNITALNTLFGSVEATGAALAFAGSAGQSFTEILAEQREKAGATAEAFAKVAEALDTRLKVALSDIVLSLEKLGTILLTVIVPAVEVFAAAVSLLVDNIDALIIAFGLIASRSAGTLIKVLLRIKGLFLGTRVASTRLGKGIAALGLSFRTAGGFAGIFAAALRAIPFIAVVSALTSLVRGYLDASRAQEELTRSANALIDSFGVLDAALVRFGQERSLETALGFQSAANAAVDLAKANLEAAQAALDARREFNAYNVVTDLFRTKTREAEKAVADAAATLIELEAQASAAEVAVDQLGAEANQTGADMRGLAFDVDGVTDALKRLREGSASAAITQAGQRARLATLNVTGDIRAAAVAEKIAQERARVADLIASSPDGAAADLQRTLDAQIENIRLSGKLSAEIADAEAAIREANRPTAAGRGPGAGAGSTERNTALATEVQGLIQKYTDLKNTIGLTNSEIEEYNIRQQLTRAAAQDGIEITEAQIQSILGIKDAYEQAKIASDTFANGARLGMDDFANSVQTTMEFTRDFTQSAFQGLSNTIAEFVKTGKFNWRDLLADLLGQIASFLANQLIIDFLGLSGGAKGGTKGLLSDLFGGIFGGGLATGGPTQAGKTYLVGEEGPEFFTPNRSGRVIPNDETESMMRSSAPQIVFNITTQDADSFRRSEGQIRARMATALQSADRRNN